MRSKHVLRPCLSTNGWHGGWPFVLLLFQVDRESWKNVSNVFNPGKGKEYFYHNMRGYVPPVRGVQVARKSRRFTIRANVDRVADCAVESGTKYVL
jgi:hypothetical protein